MLWRPVPPFKGVFTLPTFSRVPRRVSLPPTIQTITGGLTITADASLKSFEANGLTVVGMGTSSNLSISNCSSLTTASFPQLKSIGGGFNIFSNSVLLNINGFPLLQNISGDVNLLGDFNNLSLPSLAYVGGGVDIQSSSSSFKCPFPEMRSNGVVHGQGFICAGNIENPTSVTGVNLTAGTKPSTAATPSGSSSSAANINVARSGTLFTDLH